MTTGDLERVAEMVRAAGFAVTVEHPGCIVIPDAAGAWWWWGTANGYWDADRCTQNGEPDGGQLRSSPAVYAEESDPAIVAGAIVRAMQGNRDYLGG